MNFGSWGYFTEHAEVFTVLIILGLVLSIISLVIMWIYDSRYEARISNLESKFADMELQKRIDTQLQEKLKKVNENKSES